jgi:transcriptional regulator with XRE-family HTH domain
MDWVGVVAMNVRKARQAAGLTQEELASISALSSRYIGKIETARVAVSITVLGQIAMALKISPADLLQPSEKRKRS